MRFDSLHDESNTKKPKKPATRRALLKLEDNQAQSGAGKANKSVEANPESAKNSTAAAAATDSIRETNQHNGSQLQQPKQCDQAEAYHFAQLADEGLEAKKLDFDDELLKEILIEIQENNEPLQSSNAACSSQSAAHYSSENSRLNEIIDELIDFTSYIPSPSEPARTASADLDRAELLKREQSQINSYMSQMNDLSEVESFDFELFDNILISNSDPMLANIKLL